MKQSPIGNENQLEKTVDGVERNVAAEFVGS